jgi:hypothetical protein
MIFVWTVEGVVQACVAGAVIIYFIGMVTYLFVSDCLKKWRKRK